MRYQILGPLAVSGSGDHPAVTAGRDRVVLAMLLLHPDRVLGVGELVDAVWGEDPPATARNQLQTCVSRLRRALPPGAIQTDPAGYRIEVGPGELDSAEFDRLVAAGRVRRDPGLYRQALGLWRGPALVGIEGHAVRRAAAVLDERRAITVEDWADLAIAAGGGRELIGELSALVEEFPLRERLRGQLMTALHHAGRQGDALAEYRRAREVLRDELGIEPGLPLRELHRQILAGSLPEPPRPAAAPAPPAPVRCLPRTVGDFTGRSEMVRRLVDSITRVDPGGPAIAVIDGMAGIGKTTVALHVAALVGERFPDAHLFVDLHGHSRRAPLEPAAALLILLRQLGVDAELIPPDPVHRVALWRSELARRRVLLVLDNASSSTQLEDLLPTAPGSLALVTSRRRLAGLDGVHPESLAVLPAEDAAALLARIAGDRVAAEPEAAAEVVRRCGGLPLAIRLAGARLAHRPRWRVADLLRRLGEATLPELAAEDRTVASAFALSYGQLPAPAQRVFRLLGLYPGTVFDGPAVAALTGMTLDDARDVLDDLVDVHLVDEPEPEVYRLHDLLREFAAALAAELSTEDRRAAVLGVLDLQLHAAAAATTGTARETLDRDLRAPQPVRPELLAALSDPAARLERERTELPAFVEAAVAHGHPEYGWWIPRAAWRHLYSRGYDDDLRLLLGRAMVIVEQLGDRAGLATVANYLAGSHVRTSEFDKGRQLLEQALRLRRETGTPGEIATVLGNLATIYESTGHFADCVATASAARRLAAQVGDVSGFRVYRYYLGMGYGGLGRPAEALRHHRLAMLAAIEEGDQPGIALALIHMQRHKLAGGAITIATARRYVAAGLRLMIRHGHRFGAAGARNELARLLRAEGRFAEASVEHRAALEVVRRGRNRRHEAEYLCEFAATRLAAGDPADALDLYQRALLVARQAGLPFVVAGAEAGIAACVADQDPQQARRLWTGALATFRELGMPERFAVERRLAALEGGVDQLRTGPHGGTMVG